METIARRKSWDTTVKDYYRLGLEGGLPKEIQNQVPKSSLYRWKNEPENKYIGCEITAIVKKDLELVKKIIHSKNIKKINESYFKLSHTFSTIIKDIKGIKSTFKNHKEVIVNTVEAVKDYIPINDALHLFNLSRSTYQNYKSIIIHKCEASYFKWCTKRYSNQLLPKEVETIKRYMMEEHYKYWSKSSVYLRAIRDETLLCGLSTFYKYCRLLGFKNIKRFDKIKDREPLITTKPNEVWCADVTIFKTKDHVKHYIHVLMDHYSKKKLGTV